MIPTVVSRLTEDSLRVLAEVTRLHNSLPPEHIVLSVASALEAHVDQLLDLMIDTSGVLDIPVGGALRRELQTQIHQSWPARHDWLKKGFGISLAGGSEANDVDLVVQLRNAIVHGGGHLTKFQTREMSKLVDLRRQLRQRLGVNLSGTRIDVGASTALRSIHMARAYFLLLDTKTLGATPPVRTQSLFGEFG